MAEISNIYLLSNNRNAKGCFSKDPIVIKISWQNIISKFILIHLKIFMKWLNLYESISYQND